MERWDTKNNIHIEDSKIELFLKEIKEVCKKHNFSIAHEDRQGAFIIEPFDNDNIEWLMDACLDI